MGWSEISIKTVLSNNDAQECTHLTCTEWKKSYQLNESDDSMRIECLSDWRTSIWWVVINNKTKTLVSKAIIDRQQSEWNLRLWRPLYLLPLTDEFRQVRSQICQGNSIWNLMHWRGIIFPWWLPFRIQMSSEDMSENNSEILIMTVVYHRARKPGIMS